ncbi:MAG: hypothetical protein A2297_06875 [Elusimicrobia bacterium RIFOXYB2_FULL_48_7]|nr:MAG: hypothetical protein A2297_06875 [Elusimicrobia bacterium RIFOXYB2_FULL_48_7]
MDQQEPKELQDTISILRNHKPKPVPQCLQTRMDAKIDELFENSSIPATAGIQPVFKWQFALGIFILGILAGTGVFTVSRKTPLKIPEPVNTIEIGREAKLSFPFFSQEDVKDIVFNVNLPEGVFLASSPEKREVHWKGGLVKGKNVICIYVKAQKEGAWSIDAKLQTDGTILKEYKMPLNITERKG